MSDQEPPTTDMLTQRVEAFCTEIIPLAEEYEAAKNAMMHEPRIHEMRNSWNALKFARAPPSATILSATAATFKAAIPALEDVLDRLESCSDHFTILLSTVGISLNQALGEDLEARSQILKHQDRDLYLKYFGLVILLTSLEEDSEETMVYATFYLEHAKGDDVGTEEWADALSIVRLSAQHTDGGYL